MQANQKAGILRQIRKSREFDLPVGNFTFRLLRPTANDVRKGYDPVELASDFVVGWKGVTEADIIPQGVSDELEFDRDVWVSWLADRKDFWQPIAGALVEAYEKHQTDLEASVKN